MPRLGGQARPRKLESLAADLRRLAPGQCALLDQRLGKPVDGGLDLAAIVKQVVTRGRACEHRQRQHLLMVEGAEIAVEIIPCRLHDTAPVRRIGYLIKVKFKNIGL
jgi:hypothetical protein